MKKIGITLDFVIRDYLTKLKEVYITKYDIEPLRITSLEGLHNYFPMIITETIEETTDEFGEPYEDGITRTVVVPKSDELCVDEDTFNQFIGTEFAWEIFGASKEVNAGAMHHVNHLSKDLKAKGYELVLLSEDNGLGRGSTLFFLGKTMCQIGTIIFTSSDNEELKDYEVIITADEKFAKGKKVIKIKNEFNDNFKADKEFNSIKDVTINELF